MNPAQYWALEMQNRQMQQEQQQYNQQIIMQGLMDIAGAYQQNETMKSSVKSGETLLKVLGPSMGMTTDVLKEVGYNDMNTREKAMFHEGWLNNFATAAQSHNFGSGLAQRAGQPFVNAGLQGARDRASGNQTFTGATDAPPSVAPVEPPLPPMSQAGPVDQAPGASAPQAPAMPGGTQSKEALNRWRRSQGLPPIP
jgi:hypothetical protein